VALAHALCLILHSWLRWVVLTLAIVVTVRAFRGWRRARAWEPSDERAHRALIGVLDLQFLLGVALYLVLSPFRRAFFADPGAAMKVSVLRFFGLEHWVSMLLAVAILHVGRTRSKKVSDDRRRHRIVFATTLAGFVIAFAAVPWPFSHAKRPLFRLSSGAAAEPAPASLQSCPPVYESRCAACHGKGGAGDGVLSASLSPRPRAFGDSAFQSARTDDALAAVIRGGGRSRGMSPLMPASPDLSPEEIRSLVGCVRLLGKPR